jgi:type I restriction-modification system DNA methylase subunit
LALTQQELEARLWAAANSPRGPVDPADFKAYISPWLFYKRVSDAWDDEHQRAVVDYGSDLTPEKVTTLDEFLRRFSTVTRRQAVAVLEHARQRTLDEKEGALDVYGRYDAAQPGGTGK